MLVHLGGDIDQAVMLQVAAMVVEALDGGVFGGDGLEIDHGEVAALGEIPRLIENVSDTARHAGGEVGLFHR